MRRTTVMIAFVCCPVFLGAIARVGVAGEYKLNLPLGLQEQALYLPPDNPLTAEKIALGKQLYFDTRLSLDKTVACASCHNPRFGYTDGQAVSTGIGGQKGGRSAPTTVNRAFSKEQFWDGRAADLEAQAIGPIASPIEMGFTHEGVVKRLRGIEGYREQFKNVFGTENFTIDHLGKAIAAFERTILSGNSPFDRFEAGDRTALSRAAAERGLTLFRGKANCVVCHAGFNFTDEGYHNIGVGMDKPPPDLGRFDVTKREEDRGAFKTPTLRDIALSAPYFHDGSARTLDEVVEFYNHGGIKNLQLSKEIKPLGLSTREKADLVEFMRALTGEIALEVLAPQLPQ
ncbi:MAG: cytochrome-c peroxidase [Anaerolineales bacterium]